MLSVFSKMFGAANQPVNQQQPVVNAASAQIPNPQPTQPSVPAETPLPQAPVVPATPPLSDPVVSPPAVSEPVVPPPSPTAPDVLPPAPSPQTPVSEPESLSPEPIAPMPTILNAGPIPETPQVPAAEPIASISAPAVVFDEQYKNKIGTQLTKTLVQGVENKEITEGEMSAIAGYILENIDMLKTQDDLFAFLKDLSTEWPIFKNVVTIESNVAKQGDDEKKIEELTSLVHKQEADAAQAAGGVVN